MAIIRKLNCDSKSGFTKFCRQMSSRSTWNNGNGKLSSALLQVLPILFLTSIFGRNVIAALHTAP